MGEQEGSGREHEVTYWSLVHWPPAKSAASWGSKAQKMKLWLCSCYFANGGCCHCTIPPSAPFDALLQLTKAHFPPELISHFLIWCTCSQSALSSLPPRSISPTVFAYLRFPGDFPGGHGWVGSSEAEDYRRRPTALPGDKIVDYFVCTVPLSAFRCIPLQF